MERKKIKFISHGLGPIGKATARLAIKKGFKPVGAVDIDNSKIGKDLGELLDTKRLNIPIKQSLTEIEEKADIAIVATKSNLNKIEPQLVEIIQKGLNIISTCEELVYPWPRYPEISKKINRLAKQQGVTVTSTGINTGFLMDLLPAVMTGICEDIKYIEIERVQNAYFRRKSFQEKIGADLTKEEFKRKLDTGSFGHVGLKESVYMLSKSLNTEIDSVKESIEALIIQEKLYFDDLTIPPNTAAGLKQTSSGFSHGKLLIKLIFVAAVGQQNPRDTVLIKGIPSVKLTINRGINGDISTAAVLVNTINKAITAEPGLKTMIDICPISYEN